jgi:hypothetical protein
MSEQSVIDFLVRGAWFRGRSPLAAASCLSLSALLATALPAGALAQYPTYAPYTQSPQPGYGYNAAAHGPIGNPAPDPGPVAGQLAGQSDQQLAAAAQLFEQQGRTAQAQRIYLELQRRSLLRGQTPQTPTFNHAPPSGYGPGTALTQTQNPSTGLPSTAANQSQIGSPSYNPALRPFQQAPFPTASSQTPVQPPGGQQPPGQAATGWMPPATDAQTGIQPAGGEHLPSQGVEAAAAQSPPAFATSSPSTAAPAVATTTSVATTPVMILDRQVSPAPRTVKQTASAEPESGGWRAAITPLPAALADPSAKPGAAPASPSQSPLDLTTAREPGLPSAAGRSSRSASANSASITTTHPLDLSRQAEADSANEFPNIPALPVPEMPAAVTPDAQVRAPAVVAHEPAAFQTPATGGERLAPPGDVSEPPGVVMFPSAPPTLRLSPTAVPRTVSVQADQESSRPVLDAAAKLAKETDDIRIIPGNRSGGHAQLETVLNVDSKADMSSDPSLGVLTKGWKSTFADQRPVSKSVTSDTGTPNPESSGEPRPTSRVSTRPTSVTESADAGQPRVARPAPIDVERPAAQQAGLDLAALIQNPEFREIHTRPVLDGLELLSQPEPRHRLLGALRLGMAGSDARTALPVLHQVLGAESNQEVTLRVAETVLKLQPNDRSALDALSRLLKDPADPDVRQAAAGALGGASPSGNPTAVVRLTDALDDPNPRVRIMAALSLAQFGPAAADAVPRLEVAATSDVPRMQRAALAALASIRGGGQAAQNSEAPATPRNSGVTSLTPATESRVPNMAPAPIENPSVSPANNESSGPKPLQLDPTDDENPTGTPHTSNSNPGRVTPVSARGEAVPVGTVSMVATVSSTAWKQPGSAAPAPRLASHEIATDAASADSRARKSGEPPLLPDVPAKPIDHASTSPAPVRVMPKAAAELPPFADDSPLSLDSPPGGAKSGSAP